MTKPRIKSNLQKKTSPRYDMDSAYQAAATTLALIIQTGEAFVIRDFDIRDDKFEFAYCYPNTEADAETRELQANLCQIMGTIAGHALYCGETLNPEDFGIEDRELIEHIDRNAKILLDLCRNEYNSFIQEMALQLSKCGRLCGNRIEDLFLKHFDGKVGEAVDVEFC